MSSRVARLLWLGLLVAAGGAVAELSDPTRPADYAAPVAGGASAAERVELPQLQAVFRGPGGSSALLNGRSVRVGDELDAGRVEEIGEDYLVLSRGERQLRLQLLSVQVKQPARDAGGGDR